MENKIGAFIQKANIVHKDKYNYSKVNYINAHTKIIITCPTHEKFFQAPYHHLSGSGCTRCGYENNGKLSKSNIKEFIQKANVVHKNKYDYSKSDYIDARTKISIVCPIHGEFVKKPNNHFSGQGCPECSKEYANKLISSNTEEFVQKSNKLHERAYDYSNVQYKNEHTKVIITCKTHGDFLQTPGNHLHSRGCPKCGKEKMLGGYNESFFKTFPSHKNLDSYLYLIKFQNTIENFYKIGISLNSKKRKNQFPASYNKEVIVATNTKLYKSFQPEQKILTDFKKYKYVPHIKFRGYTECFNLNVLNLQKVKNAIYGEKNEIQ